MNYLTSKKTAFLCSRIEKNVLHYLLKGKQQIILVLVRGLKKIEFEKPMEEFNNNYSREYVENNHVRNYTAGFTETMGAP